MINTDFLDAYLPVPELGTVIRQMQAALAAAGFPITAAKSGSVFYMLLRIVAQFYIELRRLARSLLANGFVKTAAEGWLEAKAEDYSMARKQASKTRGVLTLSRASSTCAVKIPAGHVFKTSYDINGEQLCFIVTQDTVFKLGETSCGVPVEAEFAGSAYNCAKDTITETLINLESGADVISITNGEDWITREGTDIENLEVFRERILNAWSGLATLPTADTYKAAAEAVEGVLRAQVDDLHPRGQGTVDIIVTSSAGEASFALLTAVTAAVEAIAGPYDNLLVKSASVVRQNITVTLKVPSTLYTDDLAAQAKGILTRMLTLSSDRSLNELLVSDIVFYLRSELSAVRNVLVTVPAADVVLGSDKVILPGTLSVTVSEV